MDSFLRFHRALCYAGIAGVACLLVSLPIAPSTIAKPQVFTATVTLDQTAITNLVATPVNLIPAPGAGKVVVVLGCGFQYTHGGVTYVNPGGTSAFSYTGQVTNLCGVSSNLNSFFTSAANAIYGTNPTSFGAPLANAAVGFRKNGSEFTTGNGTVVASVVYVILPTQ